MPKGIVRALAALAGGVVATLLLLSARSAPPLSPAPALLPHSSPDTVEADTIVADTVQADTTAPAAVALPLNRLAPAAPDTQAPRVLSDMLGRRDTTREDTMRATPLADRYLPAPDWLPHVSPLVSERPSPLLNPALDALRHEVVLDSTGRAYTAHTRTDQLSVRPSISVARETYRQARLQAALSENWRTLREERARLQEQDRRAGVGVTVAIPGGRQSAFSTLFGAPEVDLRVTGQADINAGFDYRKSDQQANITGDASRIDPDFAQDLRLGITGTVGDKLQVDVNWDTQNPFDYQNQVKLEYSGYDDEIIQKIEAGNVFLETPSTLIQGGQSLFGIKAQFQFGNLSLTTIASQQEGKGQSLTLKGGAETHTFTLFPTDYEAGTHFFLGYYFRNRWNDALSQPPTIVLANGFERITEIQIWKLQTNANLDDPNVRQAMAVVDLGEESDLLAQADDYNAEVLPDPATDQYLEGDLERLRDPSISASALASEYGLQSGDFQTGRWRLLERGDANDPGDYTVHEQLGYISLRQGLQDNQALAVAFRYRANGQTYQVGDFTNAAGGTSGGANADRIVLKLLRPAQPRQPAPSRDPAVWYLEMRNIYSLRAANLSEESFNLSVAYAPSGQPPQETLPGVAQQQTLLQLLGLDRLNGAGGRQPDNTFDFIPGVTINQDEGLLIFPYLEPFGARLKQIIEQNAPPEEQNRLLDKLVFSELYRLKQRNAENSGQPFNIYHIEGESQGTSQALYNLPVVAGLVEGSVKVTAGGVPLQPGADYEVDYQSGTVRILNEALTRAGRTINISYEQNAIFNVQKKTLLGARANYALGEKFSLGATVMRLSERAPVDKFRIGQEPISNLIWGLDGTLNLEPRWLTRAVDALPLVQTKAPSRLSLSAEFAQLRPGYARSNAFERARSNLQGQGLDFRSDELGGISYIDDFESFENSLPLSRPADWQLTAPAFTPENTGPPVQRARQRAGLAWYVLNVGIREQLAGRVANPKDPATRLVKIHEVFPNRDTRGQVSNTLATFDLYFDPHTRGPYNYTRDLAGFLAMPKENWGGVVQEIPEGFNDFSLSNVEFVEFVFKPFVDNAQNTAGDDAVLYVDLGSISEDVVPDGRLNTEDGLSTTSFDSASFSNLARLPNGLQDGLLDLSNGRTEDVGLDGFVSYDPGAYPDLIGEKRQFTDFLGTLGTGAAPADLQERYAAEIARARRDPSGDDYQHYLNDAYFGNEQFFPGGAKLQERFFRYYAGLELNAYESQNVLAEGTTTSRGNTREPDTEDLNFNTTVDTDNSYFQYGIPLSRETLDALAAPTRTNDYIVGEIQDEQGNGTGWYQVRIPIRSPDRTSVGNISNFSLIESIRLWTTGHTAPITLRFATLELVGSQWRKSERIGTVRDTTLPPDDSRLLIASVNNEENAGVYQPPLRAVIGQRRLARGGIQNQREQSLVMEVEDLGAGHQRAVYKSYTQSRNLLKYTNLRMFVHLHGQHAGGRELTPDDRKAVELFVRLGANETEDFYEYVQPLTPTRLRGGLTAKQLWPARNEMVLPLRALNQLKVARNQTTNIPIDSLIYRTGEQLGIELKKGAQLGIKGTPSLQDVRTIVIGLRNTSGEVLDVTMWVNELRVTGYDEKPSWAALATADVQLADVATIRASFRRQTDGFGSLSSTLAERSLNDVFEWGFTAQFSLGKLFPVQQGWQIPISIQMRSETSTPRFAPNRGDVRLSEILDQIDARDSLSADEKAHKKEQVIRASQDHLFTHSITASLQKNGSESTLLHYTLDALALRYSYSATDSRSPSQRLNDSWRWFGSLQYQLGFDEAHTVRPFWFLGGVPLIGALGDLQFNYAPQAVRFSATAERSFGAMQARSQALNAANLLPERLRSLQDFNHNRQFTLQYQPFRFMNLSFDTNTDQTLNLISADTLYSVIMRGGEVITRDKKGNLLSRRGADLLVADRLDKGIEAFRQDRLSLDPLSQVVGDFFSGPGPRTESYQQRFTGTITLPFAQEANWIDFEDLTYQSTFTWNNGPLGQNTGAQVSNDLAIRSGLTLHPVELWRTLDFYRRLEAQGQEEEGTSVLPSATTDTTAAIRSDSTDTTAAIRSDSTDTTAAARSDSTEAGGGFLDTLVPDPMNLLRRLFLAVTGVRDLQITYTATRNATSSGVGRVGEDDNVLVDYSLFDALRGYGPSLGYRFGLSRRIGSRVFSSRYQVTDAFGQGNEFRARTTLLPGEDLQINLNWDLNWRRSRSLVYNAKGDISSRTESGTNQTSVWVFGDAYLNLVKRQLATLKGDYNEGASTISDDPTKGGDGNGRVALTNPSVRTDFRAAFLVGPGPLDGLGLLPFPMPGWNVSYTGFAEWPLVRSVVQSATLQHAYTATYASRYRNNTAGEGTDVFSLANFQVEYARPAFTASDLQIVESFQPLLGLSLNWKGGLQTRIAWNRQNTYRMSTLNNVLRASRTNELTLTANFQTQGGFEIPFLPVGEINNRLTLSLSISRAVNRERSYYLQRALGAALSDLQGYDPHLALEGDNVDILRETTRLAFTPRISYQFSNRIAADFVLQYERFKGGNLRPSYTNINGGFNVRVSLSN